MRRSCLVFALVLSTGACERNPVDPAPRGSVRSANTPQMALVVGNTTTLPTLGGTLTDANDINDAGQVVGYSRTASNATHAFLWTPGGIQDLGTLGGPSSVALGINDAGQIVGTSDSNAGPRAFLWTLGGMQNLGTLGGFFSEALAINDAGQVVGYSSTPAGTNVRHAFLWSPGGGMQDLGTLGGAQSEAWAINNSGQVVGWSQTAGNATVRAFLWTSGGGMQDLGTLGGNTSEAFGINNAGQVVGRSQTAGNLSTHAFLLTPGGVMQDLGTLGGAFSQARDINDAGHVVGVSETPGNATVRAFLWTSAGGMQDLAAITGLNSSQAVKINANQQVTGGRFVVQLIEDEAPPGATPPGSNVIVQPLDETTGQPSPVSLDFSNVTTAGTTTLTSGTVGQGGGPPAPGGFRLGNPPTYYDVHTTATFDGSVELCFDYSGASYGNENNLKLLHYENSVWTDVTTSLDTAANIICGSVTSLSPFLVAEANVAPVVTSLGLPAAPVPVGTSVTATASFTDANPNDTHTANIAWNDGTSSNGSVTETAGAGSASGSHTFAAPGVYTVVATVSDGDLDGTRSSTSDQPAYIVVYDPSSGFVTGGGWFDSPVNACAWSGCADDGSTTGKASFGFVSRYKKGATTPTGDTEFQFKAGGLTFRSTSYQWLVVAGARAQYKGEGQIDGDATRYGFLITAIDGALSGGGGTDRFRIKLWNIATGAIVYDNQRGQPEDSDAATAIGGGSIVIHK